MIQWTTFMGTLNGLEEEVCRNEAVDLVFLVDHSGSIGEPNALLITDFITGIVSGLNVAENNTRVAVRTFEKTTNLKFSLKDYDQDLVEKSSAVSLILIKSMKSKADYQIFKNSYKFSRQIKMSIFFHKNL